jgi:hypothetical protein
MTPHGFANPLGPNPFASPRDYWGHPRVSLTERELEQAMRAYCRLWAIPVPKSGARLKPKTAKKLPTIRGIPTRHLQGQQTLFPRAT